MAEVVHKEKLLGEMQGANQKGRETMHQVFILTALIERAHRQHKPLYLAFIDLKKTFDTVPRDHMWNTLQEQGFAMGVIEVLKAMYKGHTRKVITPGGLTEWIECT